ncbi:MAG: hypothetical protein MK085_03515 [Phycisphaerales bacterium]|nr:hypothetical protein [Phycisphaerales bacterium]
MQALLDEIRASIARSEVVRAGCVAAVLAVGAGCSQSLQSKAAVPVQPGAFRADAAPVEESPIVNATEDAVGTTVVQRSAEEIRIDGETAFEEGSRVIATDGQVDEVTLEFAADVGVGDVYTVDGLVGQINGRPIYADEFFLPLQDRLVRLAAELSRPQALQQMEGLVTIRFREFVNSELIIAEAESRLNPEMQQGIFSWLRSMQEQTIAERGGTRATAEQSIEQQFGMTLEDFLEQRRTIALASDLLRKRVTPRTIVSWRDVEQAYRQRWAEFNPPSLMRIGRIRFSKTRQPEQLEQASALVQEGLRFKDICDRLGVPDDGFWLEVTLPPEGVQGTSLVAAVKDRLEGLEHGDVSEPLEQTAFTSWFTVLEVVSPPSRSIYDPEVQISIESQLSDLRYRQEQERYLKSLRNRWITDDINQMRLRLLRIARSRYLPD